MAVSREEIERLAEVLEALVENRSELAVANQNLRNRVLVAAGRLSLPERDDRRRLAHALRRRRRKHDRAKDEDALRLTGIRKKREEPVFVTPESQVSGESGTGVLRKARSCYVCKREFVQVHHFYDQMCTACGDFNFGKRSQTADLHGRTAYVSGARVKIGYQAAIMLLRAGARVVVSTRFPTDAALRYSRERDFSTWQDRLAIYGLDLRHTPSVEAFADHIGRTEERLDFVLHNACQTVRRPPGFYRHLLDTERTPWHELHPDQRMLLVAHKALVESRRGEGPGLGALPIGLLSAPVLSQAQLLAKEDTDDSELFPAGLLDADLQQVDQREINSWRLQLHEVSTVELLEVQLVNAIAPFVLNARLKPLLLRHASGDKHVVNVSALEGQFYRRHKTDKHPHTNMAKAALNMMTRTSAADFIRDGIHMNSVDTGWVTDEDPAHHALRKRHENGFTPPLDIVDGAARIVDPIFDGINTGTHVWGQFLKDYRPAPW